MKPPITRAMAAEHLQTIAEVIVENYSEYKDYNSTTTQSDHGELLYTLIDCLRLKASYERVCWNIRPIVQAHEVLMRHGQIGYRRTVAPRLGRTDRRRGRRASKAVRNARPTLSNAIAQHRGSAVRAIRTPAGGRRVAGLGDAGDRRNSQWRTGRGLCAVGKRYPRIGRAAGRLGRGGSSLVSGARRRSGSRPGRG